MSGFIPPPSAQDIDYAVEHGLTDYLDAWGIRLPPPPASAKETQSTTAEKSSNNGWFDNFLHGDWYKGIPVLDPIGRLGETAINVGKGVGSTVSAAGSAISFITDLPRAATALVGILVFVFGLYMLANRSLTINLTK